MIDERSYRRPEFTEGLPLELADGQNWHLPTVAIRHELIDEGEAIEPQPILEIGGKRGEDLDPIIRDALAWLDGLDGTDPDSLRDRGIATIQLAASGLRMNYDLTAEQAFELILRLPDPAPVFTAVYQAFELKLLKEKLAIARNGL